MLYRKRNIDLLVIHFALKQNLVAKKCWPASWAVPAIGIHGKIFSLSSGDPGITIPGSQLARLTFFHVIVKLIFSVFNGRTDISAN